MQNYDAALKATTVSENSQGSALQENARYLESAQSKINSLEVAWQEFAITASKSFMMDGIILGVNALKEMTNALNAIINLDPSKGNLLLGLGMVTAAMGGLATLMNPTLRGFATQGGALDYLKDKLQAVTYEYQFQQEVLKEQRQSTAGVNAQSAQTLTFMDRMKSGGKTAGAGMRVLSGAIAGVGKSIGMMMITSLGVGLALAGITAAIGWIVKKFAEAKNEADALEKKMNNQIKTYSDNKDSIDELVDRYEELKSKTNKTAQETELFYQTQKQLGNYMPELVAKVDEQGRTHLSTSVSIKKHVEQLKELEALKSKEKLLKKKDNLNDSEEELADMEKAKERLEKALKVAKQTNKSKPPEIYLSAKDGGTPQVSEQDQAKNAIKEEIKRAQAESARAEKTAEVLKLKQDIFDLERKQEIGYDSMSKEQRKVVDSLLDQVDGAVLYNDKTDEGKKKVKELKDILAGISKDMADMPTIDEKIFSASSKQDQGSQFNSFVENSISKIEILTARKRELEQQGSLSDKESLEYSKLNTELSSIASTVSKNIPLFDSFGYKVSAADKELVDSNMTMGDAQVAALNLKAAQMEATDAMGEFADAADMATAGASTLAEQLGYTDDEFSAFTDTLGGYNEILLDAANGHTFTADEMMSLVKKMPQLASAFKVENGVVKLNQKAVEALREAQLKQFKDKVAQQKVSLLNTLTESKYSAYLANSKIKSIKTVAQAELMLVEVKKQQMQALIELERSNPDPNARGIMHAYDVNTRTDYNPYYRALENVLGQIKALDASAAIITEGMGASIKDLNKANKAAEEQNKKTTESEKDKQETLTDSTYLTNKYTEAIDKATRALEKQQSRRQKYVKGSKAYSESIKKEIDLLKKQIEATNAYEKALEDANKKKKLIPTTGVSNGEVTYVVDKDGKIKQTTKPKDTTTYKPPASSGGSKSSGSSSSGFKKTGSKVLSGWGTTNSPYGQKRTINGKTWVHEGIDLKGYNGERLDSRVNGTVVHAGGTNAKWGVPWQYGNTVVIQSGSYLHFHAHLSKITVKTGQKVGVGQQIGSIGSTGNSTGAHLHYEIRKINSAQNGQKSQWGKGLVNPTSSAKSAESGKKTTYKWSSGSTKASVSSMSTSSISSSAVKTSSSSKSPLSYLKKPTNKIKDGYASGLLKGKEDLFEKFGKQYGVDPVLAMAIAMAETGRGTSDGIKYKHNVGGMMSPSSNWKKLIQFDNINQGIESHIKNLAKNYSDKKTLSAIQKKYAPRNAANDPNGLNKNWLGNVEFFYKEMFASSGSGSSSSNKSKSSNPKTESEAKKKADAKKKAAETKAALAAQKQAERDAEISLNEQKDALSQAYLELFTNRADMVHQAYEEFVREEEDLRARRERMSGSTESGIKVDEMLLTNAKKQRIKTEQEISQITEDLTGKSAKYLTTARRAELLQRKADLKRALKQEKYEELDALADLLRDKASLRERLERVQGNKYTERNAYLDRRKSVLVGESNTDQIKNYRYTVEQEANTKRLFAIKKRAMDYEVKKLAEVQKKYGRTSQMYKDQLELVQKYSEELLGLEQSIIDLNNAQREMLAGQADSIIDTLRDAIEQRRDAEIKAIEEVEEKRMRSYDIALNKQRNAHEEKMKQMDDEQDKYNKFIDDRLKAMDKEDDSRSNKKQMDEFAKNEADIRKQLNALSLDDSYEAKAKRKELLKQLEDLEKERSDYLYDRNRDKQREALEDERDAYNENMDKKKEAEDKAFDDYEKLLEKRREAEEQLYEDMKEQLNKSYDELLNDERKWGAIRDQIMKGHYDNAEAMAKDMLKGTSKYFKEVLDNSGDTFKGIVGDMAELYDETDLKTIAMSDHLKKALDKLAADGSTAYDLLGDSIENNIIAKLKEVLDLMKRMKDENFNTTAPTPSAGDDHSNDNAEGAYKMYANQAKSGQGIDVRDSVNGKIIGSLMHGRQYEVIRKTDSHSQIKLDNGQVGWVKNSELSTTNVSTKYGTGFDDKHQDKIQDMRKIIDDFQEDYKYSSSGAKARLSKVKAEAGQGGYDIYLEAMKEKEKYIDTMENEITSKYKKDFENAKNDDDRWKVASRFTQALDDLRSQSIISQRELDALYNDLINKVKDTKTGTSKAAEDVALRKDPYYLKDNAIKMIDKGTKVKILGDKGLYYQVEADGKKGYVLKDKIAKFKTGGMTPGNIPESGAMAILHKKELVLTEQQTANLLKTIKQTDAMMKPMQALWKMMNGVKTKPNIAQRRDDGVMIENIHLDFSNNQIKDGKQGAREFAKELINLQQNKFNKRF
ncbi:peptidoglycan DD-metalloendopeptidase family protein [Exiguobacterium sp. s133]|uniref:peptidoglycan DD-metalloendopeptidase family protein n=1 Tax=Exiguobacterium sp. s133 TaxID=2751213 RepID=UPI002556980B|nr:peptidoglycan DD-metalloendopeptidase family protein [Exiguobacterium sp. s133]